MPKSKTPPAVEVPADEPDPAEAWRAELKAQEEARLKTLRWLEEQEAGDD